MLKASKDGPYALSLSPALALALAPALDCGIPDLGVQMLRSLRRLYQKATPETLRGTWQLRL